MSPFALNLEKTKIGNSLVILEPALNAFGSMLLVAHAENEPGIHEWVTKTQAQMSSDERFRHKLVMIGFHYSVIPQAAYGTFESYLDNLEATPPSELRDRLLKAYSETCLTEEAKKTMGQPVDWEEV